MATRISLSMLLGILVTVALFYLMQALIAGGRSAMTKNESIRLVDFVRVKQQMQAQTKEMHPKKPPPPEKAPPPATPKFNVAVNKAAYSMQAPDLKVDAGIKGNGFGISDGEYLPIVKVQPMYPQRALSRGLSGWVIVQFTVTSQGTVKNPTVVSNCAWIKGPRSTGECQDNPNSIFDSAAVRAALKFKYKPRVIDGQPVDTAGVENKITFELVDDKGR